MQYNISGNSSSSVANLSLYHKQREYLLDLENYGSLMLAVVIDALGSDFLNYKEYPEAPEAGFSFQTVLMDLEDKYKFSLPKPNVNKLGAAIAALKSIRYYREVTAFIVISRGLSGDSVDCDYGTPLDPEDMLFAMWEVQKLNPPPIINGETTQYADGVVKYIYIVLANAGITDIPSFLRINDDTYAKVKNTIDWSALDLEGIDKGVIDSEQKKRVKEMMTGIADRVNDFNAQLKSLPILGRTDSVA